MFAFEFATAARIIFGAGASRQIAPHLMGRTPLVVIGGSIDRAQPLLSQLSGLDVQTLIVESEPSVAQIIEGTAFAHQARVDFVIGFGGGSAIDVGKAIAALTTNPGHPLDYLEVVGKGQPLQNPPLPYIAIPTTAGTGAEVTRNAVLAVDGVKVSLRSPLMLPRLAIVDPELTYSLPPHLTAYTGMDALTQCIEPFVSNQANPLTDAIAREGMSRAARSLRRAVADGSDPTSREDMALASLMGGLALANAKLGAVHGFAGVLGGMYSVPHGAICAALLPHVLAMNVRVLAERAPNLLGRFDEVARIVTGRWDAAAADGVRWVQDLVNDLRIPSLGEYGVSPADFARIIPQSSHASSMKGNPAVLTDAELRQILEMAL